MRPFDATLKHSHCINNTVLFFTTHLLAQMLLADVYHAAFQAWLQRIATVPIFYSTKRSITTRRPYSQGDREGRPYNTRLSSKTSNMVLYGRPSRSPWKAG